MLICSIRTSLPQVFLSYPKGGVQTTPSKFELGWLNGGYCPFAQQHSEAIMAITPAATDILSSLCFILLISNTDISVHG